jgi:hypothetical protein
LVELEARGAAGGQRLDGGEIVRPSRRAGDGVAARQRRLGQRAAEPGADAGDEPVDHG